MVMEESPSDSEVVARSLEEPTTFELVFDRHFPAVHRYLHRRAGRDLADDLAAETFALAFERRASCRATGTVLPWLYGIATNLLRHRWRAESRQLRAYARSGVDRWATYEDEAAGRVTAPVSMLGWHAPSRRCGRASGTHCCSTRSPT